MNRLLFGGGLGILLAAAFGLFRATGEAAPVPANLPLKADPLPPPPNPDQLINTVRDGKVLRVMANSLIIRGLEFAYSGGKMVRSRSGANKSTVAGEGITFYRLDGNHITPTLTGVEATVSREEYSVTAADGKVTTVRRADQPARRYKMSAVLANGGFPPDESDRWSYRLSDVRTGDEVTLRIRWADGEWTCTAISITRRPGGRVPPSQKPNKDDPAHERANAFQDWEEKGTPLPDRWAGFPDLQVRQLKRMAGLVLIQIPGRAWPGWETRARDWMATVHPGVY